MKEIWKDIIDYEGLYQVSNLGRVKSLAKFCGHRPQKEKILKQQDLRGYKIVTLCKNSILKRFQVHRLVGLAFIDNPQNKPCINHKDENRSNNNSSNLQWVTWKENTNYCNCIKNSLNKRKPILQKKYGQKVKCIEKNIIFNSLKDAAKWCNGCWSVISACVRGKTKTAYGYRWQKIGNPKIRIGFKCSTS